MRFRYQTIEFGDIDVHLRTLRDTNQFDDRDGEAEALNIPPSRWPLFGVVWPSSLALAGLMAGVDFDGLRILEVGCGIGLASMVLNQRGADVTATDRHPEAGRFLAFNTSLSDAPDLTFSRSDWREEADDLGRFDLIIGSDLLYDREQAAPLARFVNDHAHPEHEMILVDPGRGQAGHFARAMAEYGFSYTKRQAAADDPETHFGRTPGPRVEIHTFQRDHD